VHASRIGIMGWSQGGFVSLMALTDKDSPFKAGIVGAPPTDWRLYDTAYTERYMSTPQENIEGYTHSDALNRLGLIKPGSMLLVHGMADDNVLLANSTRVMTALQEKNIAFESMLYPGERHGIRGAAKQRHRQNLYLDFFARKLKVPVPYASNMFYPVKENPKSSKTVKNQAIN
jgi:dipeptidyl-peptidase-4